MVDDLLVLGEIVEEEGELATLLLQLGRLAVDALHDEAGACGGVADAALKESSDLRCRVLSLVAHVDDGHALDGQAALGGALAVLQVVVVDVQAPLVELRAVVGVTLRNHTVLLSLQ